MGPAAVCGQEHFIREARKLIAFVRSSPRKPGVDAIRLPGDRSHKCRERRRAEGIPLDGGTWDALALLARQLAVSIPEPQA